MFLLLAVASLVVMIVVDYFLGAKAEFINAWSVIERLLGREASAGGSAVYRTLGAAGEFVCVVLMNAIIGLALTVFRQVVVWGMISFAETLWCIPSVSFSQGSARAVGGLVLLNSQPENAGV
jgi:hypothetical protein